jgi:hypothetical protein
MLGFGVKEYVRNTISISCTKIVLPSVIIPLFDTQAPTRFGNYVPSSGSFLCPYELLEGRNGYVDCHVL